MSVCKPTALDCSPFHRNHAPTCDVATYNTQLQTVFLFLGCMVVLLQFTKAAFHYAKSGQNNIPCANMGHVVSVFFWSGCEAGGMCFHLKMIRTNMKPILLFCWCEETTLQSINYTVDSLKSQWPHLRKKNPVLRIKGLCMDTACVWKPYAVAHPV